MRGRNRERETWLDYMLHVQGSRENPSPCICTDVLWNKTPVFKYLDMIVRMYLLQLKPNITLFYSNILVTALARYFAHLCWPCSNDMHSQNVNVFLGNVLDKFNIRYVDKITKALWNNNRLEKCKFCRKKCKFYRLKYKFYRLKCKIYR